MIRRFLIFNFSFFTFLSASAQKFPERRIAREGNRLFERQDIQGAGAKYGEALEMAAEFPEARFNLGNVMLAGEKLDEAIELYKSVLRRDPADDEARYNLAYAQKLKQQQEDEQQDQQQQDEQQDQDQQQDSGGDQDQNGQDRQDPQPQDGQDQQDQQPQGGQSQDSGGGDEPQDGQPQNQPRSGQGGMSARDAETMLEAMQAEEDATREGMEGEKVPAVSRSGKNW